MVDLRPPRQEDKKRDSLYEVEHDRLRHHVDHGPSNDTVVRIDEKF